MKINNLVEETVCIPMSKLKPIQLSKEDAMVFINLHLQPNFKLSKKTLPPLIQILQSRLKYGWMGFEVNDDRVLTMLSVITQSIGQAILYLYYIQYHMKQKNKKELTWDIFNKIFGLGFFNKEDLNVVWNNQKLYKVPEELSEKLNQKGSDNIIDHFIASESIMFMP